MTCAVTNQKQLNCVIASQPDMMQESEITSLNGVELSKSSSCKEYGTTHPPHGWLGYNADFGGMCPTLDSGIWKHHTLLVEKEKANEQ